MTHPPFNVGSAPTEIVASLSLADGAYTLQNVGSETIFFSQKDAAPTDPMNLIAEGGHFLSAVLPGRDPERGGSNSVSVTIAGDVCYVWARIGSRLVVSSA